MRIVLVTSNEPFYLADTLAYLFRKLKPDTEVAACIIVKGAGKRKQSQLSKAIETIRIFGLRFFCYYAVKLLRVKIRRASPIWTVTSENNVPLIFLQHPINSEESISILENLAPDLLVSISSGEIFRSTVLSLAPLGCINLHSSLLPKYRGLMPSFWVLKNQEPRTGVSVFMVDEGIDSGPIIAQTAISISDNMTQAELIRITKEIGMDLIVEAIDRIGENSVKWIDNPDASMTYFGYPTRSDVQSFLRRGKRFF
jgi:methionyl-tRNA formyltransferase